MDGHCVYFLILLGEVVYIGQTANPKTRIPRHKKDKQFDSHRVIYCSYDQLNFYEERWIKKFNPRYNKLARSTKARNSSLKKMRQLYMDSFIWDMVEQEAERDNRSTSNLIQTILNKHFLKIRNEKTTPKA